MKKAVAWMMAMVMVLALAACGTNAGTQTEGTESNFAASVDGASIVAEAGSAGEELATEEAFFVNAQFTPVDSQAKALMEVEAGTADIAIVDYVTSIGSIGEGTDYADLKVVAGKEFSPEEYGIAFRKGSDLSAAVNDAIAELMADGTAEAIAKEYKLDQLLVKDGKANDTDLTEGDLAYVKEKGELVIGMTLFAPMNYYNENQELIGFETEFAKAVCEKLGITAKFVEINWDTKEIELNARNIDCIWNGLTITDERLANMTISVPYMQNKQVMVAK